MGGTTLTRALQNYARGICGGLLFSLPMIYTMEMWWAGIQFHPARQAAYVLVCLLLLLGFNRYVGMRSNQSWFGVACDAVEALGIGLLLSYCLLSVLGRFESGEALSSVVGRTLLEAGLVSIGISVGNKELGAPPEDEGMQGEGAEVAQSWHGQLVFGLCGAVIVAASVGPTEEIQHLSDISPWRILLLALASLVIGLVVLHFSNFVNSAPSPGGPLQMAAGGICSYFIALLVAGGLLYLFGRFDGLTLGPAVDQIVVLAFPASLGASAGRLLLQN